MTPTEVITILQAYSNWRKGGDGWPPSPNQTIKAINAAEKDIALKERIIDSIGSTLNAVSNERDALRAELAVLRSSMTFRTSLIGRIEAERDALRAKSAPDGWKLVPIEPTPSMKTAGIGVEVYQDSPPATDCLTWKEVEAIYTAMIEVAPEVKSCI